ncbi:MAG TPA: polysaccharide deacetylase [Sphingomonas sp.]|jgi:peptidoglycan/xylan/chitin deacetylase (PgdA/CDA1 family)|nr:polysaccharide deacetylase [Sphingomonas sp.]
MPTPVFLTIDMEFAWRHHVAGLPVDAIYDRSIEPGGVGLSYTLALLKRHGLKASFFVDPMPALIYGIAPFARMVDAIQQAGQEVQMHMHTQWTGAKIGDGGVAHAKFELIDFDPAAQRDLLSTARSLLIEAGAPAPLAFRAGSYSANDDTLRALAHIGLSYDSSHNGHAQPWPCQIGLPARQIAPIMREVLQVPVTVIEDRPGVLRTFQLCALSSGEARDALDHAAASGHAAVTIVSHGFELANRVGTRANAVHVRRFERLCGVLERRAHILPTTHFVDRPDLKLGQPDQPLAPNRLRRYRRQTEQLWSNLVEERV